jgi:uncharacterized cofD-like protein
VLAVRGAIIPSTLNDVTLVASVNGSMVEGESRIPKQNAPISRVFLEPPGIELNPEAALAIMNAELIVVGPGSLYTSILPNLLVPGMVDAIGASPAVKVYVCNVASEPGETDGFGVTDHLRVLREHVGSDLFDVVIANSDLAQPPPAGQLPVVFDRERAVADYAGTRFLEVAVVDPAHPAGHDPNLLAGVIVDGIWATY